MKIRLPLYAQIFGMLFLYLSTLAAAVLISFNAQFGFGWDALIKSPLGDRINTIADALVGHLNSSEQKTWSESLKSMGERYRVKFYVFDIFGHKLAGDDIALPPAVASRLPEFSMPPPAAMGWLWRQHQIDRAQLGKDAGPSRGPDFERGPEFGTAPGPEHGFGSEPDHIIGEWNHPVGKAFKPQVGPEFGPKFGPNDRRPPEFDHRFGPGPGAMPGGIGGPGPGDFHGPMMFGGHPPGGMPWELQHAHGQFFLHTENPDKFWICSRTSLGTMHGGPPLPVVVIALSENIWQSNLLFDFSFILELAAGLLIISIVFWWPFIHSISHALSKLTVATERIAEGRFDTRVDMHRSDEIGRLSDAVDRMAERLTNFVHGQKRFLGDISHELFSPIARLQMALELLSEESTHSQARSIEDIREEIDEMTNLVNELLAFSKAGLKGKEIEQAIVNPKTIVEELVQRMNLGEIVTMSMPEKLEVIADPLLLNRAFSNILRNSVRYAGDRGPITVAGTKLGKHVSITFSDRGPGVPEEALKRLAEPFYRPEASRSRSSGGVGLGLAIVKSCVEACNGSLALRNRAEGGLEVEIRLNQP